MAIFRQKSYDENDPLGRLQLRKYLARIGHKILRCKEDFGVDVVHACDGRIYRTEVEVAWKKFPWTGINDFRYNTVSFLGRKKKLTEEGDFYYCIICGHTMRGMVFGRSRDIFLPENYVEKDIDKGERKEEDEGFCHLDKKKCFWVCDGHVTHPFA